MMFTFIIALGFEEVCHNFFEYFRAWHFFYINVTHISLSVISWLMKHYETFIIQVCGNTWRNHVVRPSFSDSSSIHRSKSHSIHVVACIVVITNIDVGNVVIIIVVVVIIVIVVAVDVADYIASQRHCSHGKVEESEGRNAISCWTFPPFPLLFFLCWRSVIDQVSPGLRLLSPVSPLMLLSSLMVIQTQHSGLQLHPGVQGGIYDLHCTRGPGGETGRQREHQPRHGQW